MVWNTIQKIYIPPTFRGTFQLRRGFARTILMDITDGADSVQTNLNAILAQEGASVAVTNPTSFVLHIEFKGSLSGYDVPPLVVNVYSAPAGDWSFNLSLDTPEMRAALAETSPLALQFEAEADFYIEPPTQSNPFPPTIRKKLWSDSVSVSRPLIFSEFATTSMIDWLRPPSGRDYIPFTSDQIITGQQSYTCVIGDGAATIFIISHHLGSEDIAAVSVRDNASSGRLLSPAAYEVKILDAGSLEVIFPVAPDSHSLVVTILAAGPKSAFETHTHTISQIVNLRDQLDYLGSKVEYLLSLVPSAVITTPKSDQPNAVSSVASFGEILPDASLEDSPLSISAQVFPTNTTPATVSAVPGTDLQQQMATNAAALVALQAQLAAAQKAISDATAAGATIDEAKQIAAQSTVAKTIITSLATLPTGSVTKPMIWPTSRSNKVPTLLTAISGEATTHTSTIPPDVAIAGVVYRSTTGITLPPSPGRKAKSIPTDGFFASDGKGFYQVYRGTDSLWHASEMDRELSRIALSSKAFPAGGTLDFSWSTSTTLLPDVFESTSTDLFARYTMQVLAVPASPLSVTSPVVLASTDINFSESNETRYFTLSITRPSNGVSSAETTLTSYGVKEKGAPLPWGDFILVVALKEFETDKNSSSQGQLSLYVPASQLTISK
jgi:hypothetical protein